MSMPAATASRAPASFVPRDDFEPTGRSVRIPRPDDWTPSDSDVRAVATVPEERQEARPEPSLATTCDSHYAEFLELVDGENLLLVIVPSPASTQRGTLSSHLNDCIERQLTACGAPERAGHIHGNLADTFDDQLYRARMLGCSGLAVSIEALDAISDGGALDATDSGTLRWWLGAAEQKPVRVFLPEAVRALRIFRSPVTLSRLLGAQPEPELAAVQTTQCERQSQPERQTELPFDEGIRPELLVQPDPPDPNEVERSTPSDPIILEDSLTAKSTVDAAPPETNSADALTDVELVAPVRTDQIAEQTDQIAEQTEPSDVEATPVQPDLDSRSLAAVPAVAERPRAANPSLSLELPKDDPSPVDSWRDTLEKVDGNQTWSALEEQFVDSYLPLSHAVRLGDSSARARRAAEGWAESFAHSYEQVFPELCRFNQRPRMIFDLPDIAFRLSRKHDANRTQLVLVDAMRFDIGQRAHDKLRLQLTGLAECVERGVLWSALPASSGAQLRLLARGPEGLRQPVPSAAVSTTEASQPGLAATSPRDEDIEGLVAQGSEARRPRPLRAGPHHLRKLDCVHQLLAGSEPWGLDDLDRAAAEVAVSIGRFLKQQREKTLLVVFGDHGFELSAPHRASAHPENVLVPYDAWLLDAG